MSYLPLILGSWSIVATLAALVLALDVGVQRRRIEYLEALAAGDWQTVDRMMGIAADHDARRHVLRGDRPGVGPALRADHRRRHRAVVAAAVGGRARRHRVAGGADAA